MSTEEIKAYEHRLFETMNKGKAVVTAALSEYFAPDFVFHSPMGTELHGLKELEQFFSRLYDAFPDIQYTLNDLVVEGDKAAVLWTWSGTHSGAFMGVPPTNKKMTFWELEIDRFIGGKQVECWMRMDTLCMMQQLGVIPTPGKQK
jgi:hypothetical protein